ncbi:MAG: YchJ family protein [Elusimicrobia bacterium]|nr:YchJ family protein [Elusimicrobiota bacterium]
MTETTCPCGTGRPLASCCGPYHSGKASPPTAEALMRARYSAYATGKVDFVEKTLAPESRKDFDREASKKWAAESAWKGLEIVAVKGGGAKDEQGVVNFVARFSQGETDYEHREIAQFRKENGAWWFVDGQPPKPATMVKTGPDLGRNDPCHCGSGKKYKKCHALT